MSERYINIRIILDRIMRHPLLQSLSLETVVDYTVDFMRIVGVPRMFGDKTELIEIIEHRGKLPCDWYETIQVKDTKSCKCLRYASDTFHLSKNAPKPADSTFTIQGDLLYTSIKSSVLEMSYRAILVDEEGYPMVPENSVFYRALEAYIKKQHFTILFDLSKITSQSFQQAQQDYAWAVGACETEFNKLDLSKAENLFNSFRTLIIRDSEFSRGFTNNGAKEMLKVN